MKSLLCLAVALVLSGCDETVWSIEWRAAEDVCVNHGGVNHLVKPGGNNIINEPIEAHCGDHTILQTKSLPNTTGACMVGVDKCDSY